MSFKLFYNIDVHVSLHSTDLSDYLHNLQLHEYYLYLWRPMCKQMKIKIAPVYIDYPMGLPSYYPMILFFMAKF